MTRYGWPFWLLVAAGLLIGVVSNRACQPAVAPDAPPATPTATIRVVVVDDPTPRLAGSPRPHWSPTPVPERLLTQAPTGTRVPTETPAPTVTSTPEPTKRPMTEKVERG